MTCEFTVMEQGSGLSQVDINLWGYGPGWTTPQTHHISSSAGEWLSGNPQLITPDSSGADGSGRYRATMVLPVGSAPGWWVANITALDQAGNQAEPSASVKVIDSRPITDIPRLVDGDVSPGSTPGLKTVRLHLTSTRDEVTTVIVTITPPSGENGGFDADLVTGTVTDGIWQGTFDVPADEVGNWSVSDIGVIDRLGVWRNHSGKRPSENLRSHLDNPIGDLAQLKSWFSDPDEISVPSAYSMRGGQSSTRPATSMKRASSAPTFENE